MRTLTLSAAATAVGALVARGAVLTAILAVGSILLAFGALVAVWRRAEGKAREHPPQAAAVVAAVGSGLVALGAIAGLTG